MEGIIAAAIVGIGVGVLSGLLGIGGGTLMVPIFRLGFGMSPVVATATSLFTIVPTSLVGFVTHIRNKTCIPRLGLICGLAGACTSPVGVYLANVSPGWLVMLAAAIIVAYSSYTMFRKALRMPKDSAPTPERDEQLKAAVAQAAEEERPFVFTRRTVLIAIAIGLAAGLASGYVGVGGGFIMVPLFLSVLDVMMRQASGTSLVAVTILAIPGVLEQGLWGNIDYLAGIAMVVGTIPGAILGANLIRRVPERRLRFIFGAFLLLSSVMLLVNESTTFFG